MEQLKKETTERLVNYLLDRLDECRSYKTDLEESKKIIEYLNRTVQRLEDNIKTLKEVGTTNSSGPR